MRMNTKPVNDRKTFEGAPAAPLSAFRALERTVSSCFLWENEFYENGETIAARITSLCAKIPNDQVLGLALRLRKVDGLRHAPLMMAASVAAKRDGDPIVSKAIGKLISRPDEMGELLTLIAKIEGRPMKDLASSTPSSARRGIAKAITKFDAYQLAKYDRDATVRLRDVLRITHPKPKDAAQGAMWKALLDGELASPDTWEVALSGGADKREAFTRLLTTGKMPYMALLRNLRNMTDAGVDRGLMADAIVARRGAQRVLPFRYIAAARACPSMEPFLDEAMAASIRDLPRLEGTTLILVDVSLSMNAPLSKKSDLRRFDAAAGLAVIANAADARVFSFSDHLREVPRRAGNAGIEAIIRSQKNNGTELDGAVGKVSAIPHDRLIVITDEQAERRVRNPVVKHAYMINVGSSINTVNFGAWTGISGFSENVFRFIEAQENGMGLAPTPFRTKTKKKSVPDLSFEDFA